MSEFLHLLVVIGVVFLVALGRRDHRARRRSRRELLSSCASALDGGTISLGGDDFPRLDGRSRGHRVRAELIPDSMTIRRLPQLWLSVTRLEPRATLPEFAILVRPSGCEFYTLTSQFSCLLAPPPALTHEVLIRGDTPNAQALLNDMEADLARILADPKVKELAVTKRGVRIVWQAAEGRRGEHLLLRQCVFDDATVERESLERLLSNLDALSHAASTPRKAKAA